jgi:hypothetical protein
MGFKRTVSFFGLLRALVASGHKNLLDRSPGDPRRNFLGRRLVSNYRWSRRSSHRIFLWLFIITTRGNKLCTTREKKGKYSANAELTEHL